MAQNISSAVMQQRQATAADDLDDFPTPPWAVRAFLAQAFSAGYLKEQIIYEPAVGRGSAFFPLAQASKLVVGADIKDYRRGFQVRDYLEPGALPAVDWVITNPPFKLATEFICRAQTHARRGVALLLRTSFLEGAERYQRLFSSTATALADGWSATRVYPYAERVVMHKGRLPNPNVPERVLDTKRGEWVNRKPSTATSYAWFVFERNLFTPRPDPYSDSLRTFIIPPCRKQFEQDGDYPEMWTNPDV